MPNSLAAELPRFFRDADDISNTNEFEEIENLIGTSSLRLAIKPLRAMALLLLALQPAATFSPCLRGAIIPDIVRPAVSHVRSISSLSMGDVLEVDVAVIGNGPSALALSAILSGHVPSIEPFASRRIPDKSLRRAVKSLESFQGGLDEVDLSQFAEGIQRRCINPTAALLDALRFPDGDGFGEAVTCFDQRKAPMSHVLIGSGIAGGSWHAMSATTVTLSPGYWMDLPGDYSLAAHLHSTAASGRARDLISQAGDAFEVVLKRVPRWLIAEYYSEYAKHKLPGDVFLQGVVTSVTELPPSASDPDEHHWALNVRRAGPGSEGGSTTSIRAKAVVLAGGIYTKPLKLNIPGEDLPCVLHRVSTAIDFLRSSGLRHQHLLVVGAGLSAADLIISALAGTVGDDPQELKISHIFRSPAAATKIADMFAGNGHPMYSNEYRLTKLMSGTSKDKRYTPYPEATLAEVHEDGSCKVSPSGLALADVTAVAVLVGSQPDFEFLPESFSKSLYQDPHRERLFLNGQKSRHPCFVAVDPATFEVVDANSPDEHFAPGLFAIGPLRGDNTIRFILGEGLAIRRVLNQKDKNQTLKTRPGRPRQANEAVRQPVRD